MNKVLAILFLASSGAAFSPLLKTNPKTNMHRQSRSQSNPDGYVSNGVSKPAETSPKQLEDGPIDMKFLRNNAEHFVEDLVFSNQHSILFEEAEDFEENDSIIVIEEIFIDEMGNIVNI